MAANTRASHPFEVVHPLARSIIRSLPVHPLYAVNVPGLTERKNITADLDEHAIYPPIDMTPLAASYARALRVAHPGLTVSSANILFTRGSVEALDLLIRAFCEPGVDNIVTNNPTFPEYERLAILNGNPTISVPLIGENFDRFDEAAILATGGKILFLCNPNNPIGSVLDPAAVRRIIDRFPGLVVMDEAYAELASQPFRSAVELVASHPNLVVLRTFSKAWGLAGVRLGAIIAGPSVLNAVRKIVNPFALSDDAQRILANRLQDPTRPLAAAKVIAERREALVAGLEKISCVYKIYPGNANFVLIRVRLFHNVMQRLAVAGCLASDFSHVVPDSIKLTVGTDQELADILDTLSIMQISHRLA